VLCCLSFYCFVPVHVLLDNRGSTKISKFGREVNHLFQKFFLNMSINDLTRLIHLVYLYGS